MWHQAQSPLSRYVRTHAGLFLFVVVIYAAGAIAGALAVPSLTQQERTSLGSYVEVFVQGIGQNAPSLAGGDILRLSIESHLKTAGLIWVLGITILGLPLVVVVLFLRGFVSGFAASFLAVHMGYRGVLLAAASILPHSVVSVPALLVLTVFSLAFGISLLRQAVAHREVAFLQDMTAYAIVLGAAALVLGLASAVEAYITPVFIRTLSAYLA